MNENIRISDADREHVVERLREHYAEGRLTSDELDERVTAALGAKTYGDLRTVMTDLPEPETVGAAGAAGPTGAPGLAGPGSWQPPWFAAGRPVVAYRRGPRILPLVLIALVVTLAVPGAGWAALVFLKLALLFFLVMCITGIFAAARFRRHARRYWQSGPGSSWDRYDRRR